MVDLASLARSLLISHFTSSGFRHASCVRAESRRQSARNSHLLTAVTTSAPVLRERVDDSFVEAANEWQVNENVARVNAIVRAAV